VVGLQRPPPRFCYGVHLCLHWLVHRHCYERPLWSKVSLFLYQNEATPEQQRIADCLTTLDDLIAAQTQKLDALKTHKKGLMQQLFPSPEAE
jgi:type I restriction enzyme S subunit